MASTCTERRVLAAYAPAVGASFTGQGNVIHLRHPKTGVPSCYIVLGGYLQELHWFKPNFASWFIGDSVCEDAGGDRYYRLDDSRVLAWLSCKVKQTSAGVTRHGGKALSSMAEGELVTYSVGLLSEYLPDVWLRRLCSHLKVDLDASKKMCTYVSAPAPPVVPAPLAKNQNSKGKNQAKKGLQPGDRKITSFFARPR
eukprot:jgi/Mesen1/10872/ME000093S10391